MLASAPAAAAAAAAAAAPPDVAAVTSKWGLPLGVTDAPTRGSHALLAPPLPPVPPSFALSPSPTTSFPTTPPALPGVV